MRHDLSIIIPAYNEENRIEATLVDIDRFLASSDLDYEIVVVDDGSTDGTVALVREIMARIPALRVIETNPAIDLVVSDVVMPGMQGTKLAAEIENRWPGIEVILMTGYAPDSLPALQALKHRPKVLSKPISPRDLAEAIREVLGNRARK